MSRGPITAALSAIALSAVAVAGTAHAQDPGTGWALTSATGAQVQVIGLGSDAQVALATVATGATTDSAAPFLADPADAPWSSAGITPLTIGNVPQGSVVARSDGATSVGSETFASPDNPAVVGAVTAATARAVAGTTDAVAAVDGISATASALGGGLELDVIVSDVSSMVDAAGASASQTVIADGLRLDLGDLLGDEVLGQLPLSVLLDLLGQSGLPVPADLDPLVDAATAAATAAQAAVGAVTSTGQELSAAAQSTLAAADVQWAAETTLADAQAVVAGLPTQAALTQSLADLGALDPAGDPVGAVLGAAAVATDLAVAGSDCEATLEVATIEAAVAALTACVNGESAALTAATAAVAEAQDAVAVAQGAVTVSVAALADAAEAFADAFASFLASLGTAEGSLTDLAAEVPTSLDAVAGLADVPLLEVSQVTIDQQVVAGASLEDSVATLRCTPLQVTAMGNTVADVADCSAAELNAVVGEVVAVVNTLTEVLESLPTGGVEVTDLRVELFGSRTTSVVQDGATITASSGVDILEVELPRVTIAPCEIAEVACELGLGDLSALVDDALATVSGVVNEAGAAVAEVDTLPGVAEVVTAVDDATAGLVDVSATLDGIASILQGIDLGEIGSLDTAITTPGLSLTIDPQAQASFASAAAPAPAPDPAPDPDGPGTPLPATGGGLLVMLVGTGTAGLAVGARRMLRRRRAPRGWQLPD